MFNKVNWENSDGQKIKTSANEIVLLSDKIILEKPYEGMDEIVLKINLT